MSQSYEEQKASAAQNERNLAATGWPVEAHDGTLMVSGEKAIDGHRYLVLSDGSGLLEYSVELNSWTKSEKTLDPEAVPADSPPEEPDTTPPDYAGDIMADDLAEIEAQTAATEPQEEPTDG